MSEAYTPGLKISRRTVITKERRLPLKGEVLVTRASKVKADTIVAQTHLPGDVELVNAANRLGVDPKDLKRCMQKKEGEKVEKGEILAKTSGLFGLFKAECPAPIPGSLEAVSFTTGKITLRKDPIPVTLAAFVEGEVAEVFPDEGILLKIWGAYLQGIFGIGGETWGTLRMAIPAEGDLLEAHHLHEAFSGCVVAGRGRITLEALRKALELGICGIISGGIDDEDLREFLGYDLGVAITGTENKGLTLMVTEGFGSIRMAEKTFQLLRSCEGRLASVNGRTQIRAGVIRPEIIIPFPEEKDFSLQAGSVEEKALFLSAGSTVRMIREPYFGLLGKVVSLPPLPQWIETEAKTRVAEVKLENGKTVMIPRANVELAEG